jgi:lipoprotein-anchoring transpeptidase ErfK/SrfK
MWNFRKMLKLGLMVVGVSAASLGVAKAETEQQPSHHFQSFEDLNPNDPNIEQQLEEVDKDYEEQTGKSPFLLPDMSVPDCYRLSCAVYAVVDKQQQKMYLYEHGQPIGEYLTSTGMPGYETPNLDTHPNGRIYDAYTSTKFPGGDYNGLGNMPYAVFVKGGVAIHGTTKGNWSKLGTPASHGCIRLHPDNGFIFNRLVRQYGVRAVWVTVQ